MSTLLGSEIGCVISEELSSIQASSPAFEIYTLTPYMITYTVPTINTDVKIMYTPTNKPAFTRNIALIPPFPYSTLIESPPSHLDATTTYNPLLIGFPQALVRWVTPGSEMDE